MSSFLTSRHRGAPVVKPPATPERISTPSFSRRDVEAAPAPARRRSKAGWISVTSRGRPAGQPSTMTPTHLPWLSPKLVTVNNLPRLLFIYLYLSTDFLKLPPH